MEIIKENDKSKNKFLTFQSKYYDLENNFEFNQDNWKINGMIFASTALFIPFLMSLTSFLFFDLQTNETTQLIVELIKIISIAIGFIILGTKKTMKKYIKNGYGWLFFYTVIPIVSQIIFGIFAIFLMNNSEYFIAIIGIISAVISMLSLSIWIIIVDKKITKIIKESFKIHPGSIIVTGLIGSLIAIVLINFAFSYLEALWSDGIADNQNALISILDPESTASMNQKIIYAILLGVYVVIIAPFIEEVVVRHCWNLNTSNKWFAFITSSIFFGFLHYGSTGDFAFALSYTASGFIFGGLFLWSKGNITVVWLVHLFNNIFAFIILLMATF